MSAPDDALTMQTAATIAIMAWVAGVGRAILLRSANSHPATKARLTPARKMPGTLESSKLSGPLSRVPHHMIAATLTMAHHKSHTPGARAAAAQGSSRMAQPANSIQESAPV